MNFQTKLGPTDKGNSVENQGRKYHCGLELGKSEWKRLVLSLVLKSREVLEAGEGRSESGEQGDQSHRECVIWQTSYLKQRLYGGQK